MENIENGKVQVIKVKGHGDNDGNIRADYLATKAKDEVGKMKRIAIIGAYQPDDLNAIIKTIKEKYRLRKVFYNESNYVCKWTWGSGYNENVCGRRSRGVVVTEEDKIQLVFGPVSKKDKVDAVYILNTETIILQEIFLAQYIDIFKEYYTH